MNFKIYRYIKDEHEPREPRLYTRGVGFVGCESSETYMTKDHLMSYVMYAIPDERGGLVQLEYRISLRGWSQPACITTTATCNAKDVFRYKDGDSLSGHTLCLARMQTILDQLGLVAVGWPKGWPVEPGQLTFLLDWRAYEHTMRELKQAGAEERRRRDAIKYADVRAGSSDG